MHSKGGISSKAPFKITYFQDIVQKFMEYTRMDEALFSAVKF
jgi:hypothetical protein